MAERSLLKRRPTSGRRAGEATELAATTAAVTAWAERTVDERRAPELPPAARTSLP
jgi:hypothetical protein